MANRVVVKPSLRNPHSFLVFVLLAFGTANGSVAAPKNSTHLNRDNPSRPPMQCRADASSNASDAPIPPTRNGNCLISSAAIAPSPWSAVIDVRLPSAYAKGQLPNAVNLTVSEILATTALASRPILIYEQGTVQADAEVLCGRLLERGFKNARVLAGGYIGWARTQHNVDVLSAAEISTEDMMGELLSGAPLVVTLGEGYVDAPLGNRVLRIQDGASDGLIRLIKEYTDKAPKRSISRVIVIGDPSIPDSQWRTWLADTRISVPMLFHRTTPQALNRALASLQSLWAKQAHGPNKAKGCSAS